MPFYVASTNSSTVNENRGNYITKLYDKVHVNVTSTNKTSFSGRPQLESGLEFNLQNCKN